ncbi:hypothetical protein L208DRAFT_1550686 [Tricholoma matsutake]|nr:hypothetical protein L208DRAFT_1550686 [Tricholoma matsutake 945]
MDESSVEVAESKEGLDILNLLRFRPVEDGFDFIFGHPEPIWTENEPQVSHTVFMELMFLRSSVEFVPLKSF